MEIIINALAESELSLTLEGILLDEDDVDPSTVQRMLDNKGLTHIKVKAMEHLSMRI